MAPFQLAGFPVKRHSQEGAGKILETINGRRILFDLPRHGFEETFRVAHRLLCRQPQRRLRFTTPRQSFAHFTVDVIPPLQR